MIDAAPSGDSPATTPTVRPMVMIRAAAQPARTLAGTEAIETGPKYIASSGQTPIWADSVVARGPRSQRGPTQPRFDGGLEQQDPRRGRHRQLETDGVDQERIDAHQPQHRQRQHLQPRAFPAGHGGPGGDRRRCGGPQHRRLEPGDHGEDDEDGQHGHETSPVPEALEQRPGNGQHEGHILTRDRKQVGEPGDPEPELLAEGLRSIVADDKAEVQRPTGPGHRRPATGDAITEELGDLVPRLRPVDRRRPLDRRQTGDMAMAETTGILHRPEPTFDHDRLADRGGVEDGTGGTERRCLDAMTGREPKLQAAGCPESIRVAEHRRRRPQWTGLQRAVRLVGSGAEMGADDERGQHQPDGAATDGRERRPVRARR